MAARTSLRDYQRELAERLKSAETGRFSSKLGLQVAGSGWLVDLQEASEMIPVPAITPVPLTKSWFRGVSNIRGNLYTVVDLTAFIGGSSTAIGDQARLLLIGERFRMATALLIERSLGLRNPAQLREAGGNAEGAAAPWARKQYQDPEGRQWMELDLPQLVQHPEFLSVSL
jgi:twitching motility protein PilI